jgi:signal transduction histidine kinase
MTFSLTQAGLLDILFDRMPMGVAVFDAGLCLRRWNPTFAEFLVRYTGTDATAVRAGAGFYTLAPGTEAAMQPVFARVLAGDTVRQDALRLESRGIVSYWDAVLTPLVQDGAVVGVIDITTDATERVLESERLEQRLGALVGIAESLTLGRPMEETLDALAARVVAASTAVACSVWLFDAQRDHMRIAGSSGLPPGYLAALEASWRGGARSQTLGVFRSGEPLFLPEARRSLLADPLYGPIHPYLREMTWDIGYILPLRAGERGQGAITLFYRGGDRPDAGEEAFLRAAADQAAVAIEHAYLYAQAQRLGVLEERQRIARELHDSVQQTLFGIALGARTARTLLEREPEQAKQPLDYIIGLAEAGAAETRALIVELRPEVLESEGLVVALERQAAALRASHGLTVETHLGAEPDISSATKEALYRIAQEALHNTVKHAGATRAEIRLTSDAAGVTLDVRDNGSGFDPRGPFPGHLGQRTMRERAERLGGTLTVDSAPGRGTCVRAVVPRA